MLRYCLVMAAGLLATAPASAGSWAEGMFQEPGKDFGLVPRGPTQSHYFHITNRTDKTVHIAGVRVSCGCTTATALQDTLAPGQSTAVQALMDTRRFIGQKQVTVFVTFDQPQWDEVSLFVRAYGSDDISFSPGEFGFPSKLQTGSAAATSKVTVHLNGSQWQVLEADRDSSYITTAVKETHRDAGGVDYEVTASLNKDTPAGKWYTDIWLKTNQAGLPRIRIPLSVEIEPKVLQTITFGEIKAGEKMERKFTIKGDKPFRITGIMGTDTEISAKGGADVKKVQEIVVTLKPGKAAGALERKLIVVTDSSDLKEVPVVATWKVTR